MSIWVALILITLCAIAWDIGIVLQKLAVDEMPRIRFGRGLPAALRSLLKSRRWTAGLAASALGWGLFAYALAYTPVSVARAIQGSGFVVLAIFSMIFLRHRLSIREWIGVVLVTAGIVALGISEGHAESVPTHLSYLRLAAALSAFFLVCLAVYWLPRLLRIGVPGSVAFSVIAGILLGLGDVATKIVIETLQRGGSILVVGCACALLIATYVSGFLALSRSYQQGRAILVTAVSDLCSRLVAICVGIAVLGEALARDRLMRALAVTGYAGIIAGSVLLARFSGEGIAQGLANKGDPATAGDSQVLDHADEGEKTSRP